MKPEAPEEWEEPLKAEALMISIYPESTKIFDESLENIKKLIRSVRADAVAEERKKFAQILVKISNESVDGVASRIQEHIALLLNRP